MADELDRARRAFELALMAQPRNPYGVAPENPGLLSGTGIPERLALLNQMFNPVEAIGQSMQAGGRLTAPNAGVMDRVVALGDMLSGVAGVAGPTVAAGRAGVPASAAMMEGLLGWSPTREAAGDIARQFVADESGALRLYHGSPHDFDKFSMSKIGTGEGAQAYGHGLYFAEAEPVARGYRNALAGKALLSGDPVSNAWDMIHRVGGNDPQTREMIRESFVDMMADADQKTADFARRSVEAIDSGAVDAFKAPGRMYEVNINANPEDFLDWDKPLSEQPQRVRDAFSSLGTPERLASVRGEDAYRALGDQLGALDWPVGADAATRRSFYNNAAVKSSEALRKAGIPGIRYLDQMSRGAGNGTSNFVVFDENLINIVKKYGIAGAAVMLGMSQADVAQAMQQQQPQGLLSGAQ